MFRPFLSTEIPVNRKPRRSSRHTSDRARATARSLRGARAIGSTLLVLASVLAGYAAVLESWTQQFPNQMPSARFFHAMTYDSARHEVVLFGGLDGSQQTVFGDTWVWNGVNWIEKTPPAGPPPIPTSPPQRFSADMVFDTGRNEVVLFGGLGGQVFGDTWVWDGATWILRATGGPPPRLDPGMAYDASRREVVLFGGDGGSSGELDDTWVWDGTSWTQKFPAAHPSARLRHAMTFDAARSEVVLFGGGLKSLPSLTADTWVWDGINWTQRFPAVSPPSTGFSSMVFDAVRSRVILFGGQDDVVVARNDTWAWDGTNWTRLFPPTSPSPRIGHRMAYDSGRHETVLFGGTTLHGDAFDDTWVLVSSVGPPTNRDDCKHEGWRVFNMPRAFKNQGDCIQFVNTGK